MRLSGSLPGFFCARRFFPLKANDRSRGVEESGYPRFPWTEENVGSNPTIPTYTGVAQLVRAPLLQRGGRWFEANRLYLLDKENVL